MWHRLWVALSLTGLCACHRGSEETPLRIGVNPWPGYEYIAIAEQEGMFDAEGLAVEIVEYSSLTDVLLAFEQGRIDALTCSMIEALLALDQSHRRPVATLVSDCSYGADMIFANKASATSAGQLKGRRIGVEVRSLGTFILGRALEKHGLAIEDVTIVPSDQLSIERQLASGEIDAAISYPPVSERLRIDPRYVEVFTTREIPEEVFDALFVDAEQIENDPTIPRKIQRVWEKALAWAENDRDVADAAMAKREFLTVEEFRNARSGMMLFPAERQIELLAPGGTLDRSLRAADRVLASLGQFESAERLSADPSSYLATLGVD